MKSMGGKSQNPITSSCLILMDGSGFYFSIHTSLSPYFPRGNEGKFSRLLSFDKLYRNTSSGRCEKITQKLHDLEVETVGKGNLIQLAKLYESMMVKKKQEKLPKISI